MADVTHLTAPELAARLRRSVQTLANWRVMGRGPRWIPGRPVLYPLEEIERWEREQLSHSTLDATLKRVDAARASAPADPSSSSAAPGADSSPRKRRGRGRPKRP